MQGTPSFETPAHRHHSGSRAVKRDVVCRVPHARGAGAADRGPRRTSLFAGVEGWSIRAAEREPFSLGRSAALQVEDGRALPRTIPHPAAKNRVEDGAHPK